MILLCKSSMSMGLCYIMSMPDGDYIIIIHLCTTYSIIYINYRCEGRNMLR